MRGKPWSLLIWPFGPLFRCSVSLLRRSKSCSFASAHAVFPVQGARTPAVGVSVEGGHLEPGPFIQHRTYHSRCSVSPVRRNKSRVPSAMCPYTSISGAFHPSLLKAPTLEKSKPGRSRSNLCLKLKSLFQDLFEAIQQCKDLHPDIWAEPMHELDGSDFLDVYLHRTTAQPASTPSYHFLQSKL